MVSGVIVAYELRSPGSGLLKELWEGGVPTVLLAPIEDVAAHLVTVDREAVTYLGMRHLLSLGRRRFGVTGSRQFLDPAHGWGRGYRRALLEFGLSPDDAPTYPLPSTDRMRRKGHFWIPSSVARDSVWIPYHEPVRFAFPAGSAPI